MNKYFQASFHIANRQNLRARIEGEMPIIVTAHGQLQRSGDTTFPFRQDSNFWYLTGIDLPDLILVMTPSTEYIIVPGRSASREAFDGAIDYEKLTDISGVDKIVDSDSGWEILRAELMKQAQVALPEPAPTYIESHGLYTNPARARLVEMLREANEQLTIHDIRMDLTRLRMIKQPEELAALQQAIDITCQSLELITALDRLRTYVNEFEVEADLTREFRFRGSAGHAFAPIIASGRQGCTLHNVSNSAPIAENSLVIMDVGAEVEQYAADITRTRIHGAPSDRQQVVFDAVLDVQVYALSLLKPGAILKDYEKSVEAYMGKTLHKLKLITDPTDHDSIRKYYPHATSHFLGLDVHDVGDYTLPLEPGMVLTCEPGIYIPEESIGVRIEDDLVITADGNRVMSDALPKTLM